MMTSLFDVYCIFQRDDKDIVFAQAYLNRTKEALKGDTVKYEQFLKILYDFGKSEQSPVKVSTIIQQLFIVTMYFMLTEKFDLGFAYQ